MTTARYVTRYCAIAVLALVLSHIPSVAFARDYTLPETRVDATVSSDGSVSVDESRTYDFDGEFNGIYWDVSKGTFAGREVTPSIESVQATSEDGAVTEFVLDDSQQPGSYTMSDEGSYYRLTLYWPASDESVTYSVSYTDPGLATRWSDAAELYWQFVLAGEGSGNERQNVACTVHLPVPEGEQVTPGDNVRAWGHGPLDGEVSIDGGDVVFAAPGVGADECLEARIAFPPSWLKDAPTQDSPKLDEILAEEQAWADEANARRSSARAAVGTASVVGVCYAVFSVAFVFWRKLRYRQLHKPNFADKYFRDVPSGDHPAVLGTLYRNGKPGAADFTASLMRLADGGSISLDYVRYEKKGFLGKTKERQDYRILCQDRIEGGMQGDPVAASCIRIDRATWKLLFEKIARYHKERSSLEGPEGQSYVLASDFEEVARSHPESYAHGYESWESAVTNACEARRFFREEKGTGKISLIVLFVIDIIFSIAFMFVGITLDLSPVLLLSVFSLVVGSSIFAMFSALGMKQMSREAIELKAELLALRRWLKDFTRLEEAIPDDVVLWNRLLVMATVLGVADEVIRQLKVALPNVLGDPCLYSYGWYRHDHDGIRAPADVMGSSFTSAHSVSASKLANSSSSSGGGGGGGFSGGGGGGFSGGSGGGAF